MKRHYHVFHSKVYLSFDHLINGAKEEKQGKVDRRWSLGSFECIFRGKNSCQHESKQLVEAYKIAYKLYCIVGSFFNFTSFCLISRPIEKFIVNLILNKGLITYFYNCQREVYMIKMLEKDVFRPPTLSLSNTFNTLQTAVDTSCYKY